MTRKISAALLLALFVFSLCAVPAFTLDRAPEPEERAVRYKHAFPTEMTIEQAQQYEQRIDDRANYSLEAMGDPTFVPVQSVGGTSQFAPDQCDIPGVIRGGYTTYDYQWNGGSHRSIQTGLADDQGILQRIVHATWMKLDVFVIDDPNRNVHYNCYDWRIPGWTTDTDPYGGIPIVEVGERGGYPHVDVNAAGNAVLFHHSAVEGAVNYPRVARFSIPFFGIFTADRLTDITGQESIWTRGATSGTTTSGNEYYYAGAQDSGPGPGDAANEVFWRYDVNAASWSDPILMGQSLTLSHELAANGDTVVYAWCQPRDLGANRNQYDNDIYYWICYDAGAAWITDGAPGVTTPGVRNLTNHVDTDMERPYIDHSWEYDDDGWLHMIYTAPMYDDEEGTISVGPTRMYHWTDDGNGPGFKDFAGGPPGSGTGWVDANFDIVAEALWGSSAFAPGTDGNDGSAGAWNRYISKMTIGFGDGSTLCGDPSESNLNYVYALYTQFGSRRTLDKEDAAASGFQNANIWLSISNDRGISWASGKCITTTDGTVGGTPTRSPDCECAPADPEDPPCDDPCCSEHWGSMAKWVNDTLHAFYIWDKSAGGVPQQEGDWAKNEAIYQPIIGDGATDGNLCPEVAPVLSATLTGDPNCEYHYDLVDGVIEEEDLTIRNTGNADLNYSVSVTHVSDPFIFLVSGATSGTIPKAGLPVLIEVELDGGGLDKGLYQGTINIDHNDPNLALEGLDPFPFDIDFFVADSFICGRGTVITTPTVALEVSNVESFGRENGEGGMWYYGGSPGDLKDTLYSPVYDASLMLANIDQTVAGPDTIVYRDIFTNSTPSNPGYRALEDLKLSYNAATNESVGTANQVTIDSLIGVTVNYFFPQSSDTTEHVRMKFKLYNNTVVDPELYVGLAADLDVGQVDTFTTNGDLGGIIADYNLVYQHGTQEDPVVQSPDTVDVTNDLAAGITALTCSNVRRMVVQANKTYVYPAGGYTDAYVYAQLDSTGNTVWVDDVTADDEEDDVVDDLHSIISVNQATLGGDPAAANGMHMYHFAVVTDVTAQEDVLVTDYGSPYDGYIAGLITETSKAWKKGFGWDFVGSPIDDLPGWPSDDIVGPTSNLYFQATGTHEGGIGGGCCGCAFSMNVTGDPSPGTITLVDDGDCSGHVEFVDAAEGTYTIELTVEDLCAEQSDVISFTVDVAQTCDCGDQLGTDVDAVADVNCDGSSDPLDVQFLAKFVFVSQDARCAKPLCPFDCGDVNCDGSVDPLDVQFLAKFVFVSQDALCDPCTNP